MEKRDYKRLYNKYKAKYLLLTKTVDNSYTLRKIDKIDDRTLDSDNIDNMSDSTQPDWPSISNKVRPSVVQVHSISYTIDPEHPYIQPANELARGSGFIIHSSSDKVLIMTNSHVVEEAKTVYIRTEQTHNEELKANVIGICPSKDLALIELEKEEIKKLDPLPPTLRFCDDRIYMDSIPVMVAGYPLGKENLKFTTGVLSGNQNEYDVDHDRFMSYLQISAAVNPGNSGGPLFNANGEVIGVNSAGFTFSQNIAYAIPTHIIISVLNDLLNTPNKIVSVFNYGFDWNNSSPELLKNYSECDMTGIYINKVNDANVLKLKVGDILHKLELYDVTSIKDIWKLLIRKLDSNINKLYSKGDKVTAVIDNFGVVKIYDTSNNETMWSMNKKKLNINELLDAITNKSQVKVTVSRNKKVISYVASADNVENNGVVSILPIYKPIDWEICLGCCFTPLNIPLVKISGMKKRNSDIEDLHYFLIDKYRNQNWIALTHIFPTSDTYKSHILKNNEIGVITHINNIKVCTMDELRSALMKAKNKYITVDFENGKRLVVSDIKGHTRKIDKKIYQENKIKLTPFAEKWTS